jgi:competence protein ComEC
VKSEGESNGHGRRFHLRPGVVLFLSLSIGIALAWRIDVPLVCSAVVVVLTCAASIVLVIRRSRQAALAIALAVIALGFARAKVSQIEATDDVTRFAYENVSMVATVIADTSLRPDKVIVPVGVESAALAGSPQEGASGRVQLVAGAKKGYGKELRYGDRIAATGRLSRPSVAHNPGGFSYRTYLESRKIGSVLYVDDAETIQVLASGAGNPFFGWAYDAKDWIKANLLHALARPETSALLGIMFGTRVGISPDIEDAFTSSGVVHILAASGLHVFVVAWFVSELLRRLRIRRSRASLLAVVFVVFYAVMAGLSPPIVRASLMFGIWALGNVLGRDPDAKSAFSVAGLAILIANPAALWDVGFQMSFACVFSLLYIYPCFESLRQSIWDVSGRVLPDLTTKHKGKRFEYFRRRAVDTFLASLSIQIGIFPLIALYFGRAQWVGVLGNVFVTPWAIILLLSGFVTAFVWPLGGIVASVFGGLTNALLSILLWLADLFARIPGADISVASPGAFTFVLYYAAIAAVLVWFDVVKRSSQKPPHTVRAAAS